MNEHLGAKTGAKCSAYLSIIQMIVMKFNIEARGVFKVKSKPFNMENRCVMKNVTKLTLLPFSLHLVE